MRDICPSPLLLRASPSELSKSLLRALEESLGAFKKHSLTGSRSVDTPTVRVRGIIPAPRPVWLGATGQGLEWSAGADDRLNAGIGPAANSNNNVRGDMPFDEPSGARLQRSLQLAVFLLGPQRCRERARHFFATFEERKVSHSIMRLQR